MTPTVRTTLENYRIVVSTALARFQLVEIALQVHAQLMADLADGLVPTGYRFKRAKRPYETLGLRVLVDEFARHTDDTKLVGRLRGLVKKRNHCAHRAFTSLYVGEDDKLRKDMDELAPPAKEALDCLKVLAKRIDELRGHIEKAQEGKMRVEAFRRVLAKRSKKRSASSDP
jgi:hypothetical protein